MKKNPILQFGNPLLRKRSKKVPMSAIRTPAFKRLVKKLLATMQSSGGIGIAAPQIGVSKRIIVLETRPTKARPTLARRGPIVLINPHMDSMSKSEESDWEGCLSLPGVRGQVRRAKRVVVRYIDENGFNQTLRERGLWARMLQHEIDHLNGILYTDRMTDMKSLVTVDEYFKRIKTK